MSRWLLILIPAALFAANPFEGTWRIDMASVDLGYKPTKFELMNGMFSCPSCLVPIPIVKADGTDQKLTGTNAYDTVSVTVIDARTVDLTLKKSGKAVEVMRLTASEDGTHRTVRFTGYPANGSAPVIEEMTEVLAEKGPAGSHAISGTWRNQKVANVSGNPFTTTYKEIPGGLSVSSPTGMSFTAKFDGQDYPSQGSTGFDMVSLKRIDDHTMDMTFKHDGKVVRVEHMVIDADGKTATVTMESKSSGSTEKFRIVKM
jgi:hypothetical protein